MPARAYSVHYFHPQSSKRIRLGVASAGAIEVRDWENLTKYKIAYDDVNKELVKEKSLPFDPMSVGRYLEHTRSQDMEALRTKLRLLFNDEGFDSEFA